MNKIINVNIDDKKSIKDFFDIPPQVYKEDNIYHPEEKDVILNNIKEFQKIEGNKLKIFIAYKNNIPKARAVALISNKVDKIGFVGHFEVAKDSMELGIDILRFSEEFFKAENINQIQSPKTDNLNVGLLIKGFDLPQTIFTNHNPKYYLDIYKKAGFKQKIKMYTFIFTENTVKWREPKDNGYKIRTFNRKNLNQEIKVFHDLQIDIFSGKDGYIDRTLEEDTKLINSLLPIIDDDLIMIAEDNGKPIGLLVCVPDVYQLKHSNKITRARIISIGVSKDYHRRGVATNMGYELMKNLKAKGYTEAEGSWVLKHNLPPQILAKIYNAKIGRIFALMGKDI